VASEVIGDTDPLSAAAGDEMEVKVSCTRPSFDLALVWLLHGDEAPAGPGFQERELTVEWDGTYPERGS
jgi:N,N-dimethylformamidase